MGISRDSRHKRSATGARRSQYRKKRKFELGRQSANTKLGAKRIHLVRVRGGNYKQRALRLEAGNFSWGSEGVSRKTRVLTVVYNASNNELVRTNTLVKGAVIQIDATPFRQWYESHYAQVLGKKKAAAAKTEEVEHAADKKSNSVQKKIAARQATAAVDPLLDDQFAAGRLYAIIASRPGQSGRCDGYILEGKELEFYIKKIKSRLGLSHLFFPTILLRNETAITMRSSVFTPPPPPLHMPQPGDHQPPSFPLQMPQPGDSQPDQQDQQHQHHQPPPTRIESPLHILRPPAPSNNHDSPARYYPFTGNYYTNDRRQSGDPNPPSLLYQQPQHFFYQHHESLEPDMIMMPVRVSPTPHLAPRRQKRRYNTTKRIKLTEGNLVLDCPVADQYLASVPLRVGKEFTHMRYTAVTNDPSDFSKYTLRQALIGRQTELFVCITMYNDAPRDYEEYISSLYAQQVKNLGKGAGSWEKVVVCIISDGREKMHPRVFDMLSALGIYQEGVAKNIVDYKPVQAHLYEYTTQLSLDPDLKFKNAENKIVPTQVLLCIKEKNQRKINSHRWFFQALCPIVQPNICMLFDVGTRPGPQSIYRLWKTFDLHANVGGACGEIRAMTGPAGVHLLNPLVASQNFEYKMSNILDKPLESVFGYISVLPGAFSAYRFAALQNDVNGHGPLEKYFLGESLHGDEAGIFEANMYLAEDRILCYELVAKKRANWVLHYVSGAYGETDVPSSVPEFLSQRRRWLNGSFFAGVYALFHWGKIFKTDHSTGRKFLLLIEVIYLSIQWLFSWFALANFFLSFYILTRSLSTMETPPFSQQAAYVIHIILVYIYGILLVTLFLLSLGNRPQGSKGAYSVIIVFFAMLMGYVMFTSVWIAYQGVRAAAENPTMPLLSNGAFRDIILSVAATYAIYLVSSLLFFDPWHMLTSFVQYLFMTPSYINILNIFAFCNTHDVSWGTKDIDAVAIDLGVVEVKQATAEVAVPEQKDVGELYMEACQNLKRRAKEERPRRDPKTKQEDYYRAFRTKLVICWLITNLVLVAVICSADNAGYLGSFDQKTNYYMTAILWMVVVLAAFRFLGSCAYLVLKIFTG